MDGVVVRLDRQRKLTDGKKWLTMTDGDVVYELE